MIFLHVVESKVKLAILRISQCQTAFDIKVSTAIGIDDRKIARLEACNNELSHRNRQSEVESPACILYVDI